MRWQTGFWSLVDHPKAVAYKLPGDEGCSFGPAGISADRERPSCSHLKGQHSGGRCNQSPGRCAFTHAAEDGRALTLMGRPVAAFDKSSSYTEQIELQVENQGEKRDLVTGSSEVAHPAMVFGVDGPA